MSVDRRRRIAFGIATMLLGSFLLGFVFGGIFERMRMAVLP